MSSRRDFLKQAIFLSGAAGFSGRFPKSIERAFSIDPEVGTSWTDAEHIVILMQENRSFDHLFGGLQGVRGFNDPRAIRQANGNSVFLQTDAAGATYAPWRLDIKDTRATWMGSIPHVRYSCVDAWNGGLSNNWIDAKRSEEKEYTAVPLTMGHYTREDLPFYYALADAFTVCDQNYCGVMSSTTPNRITFMTGTVRDRQSTHSKVYIRNEEISRGDMPWTTFPERLQTAGISWKYYQNDLDHSGGMNGDEAGWLGNFGTNVLEFFKNYNIQLTPRYGAWIQERITSLSAAIQRTRDELDRHKDDKQVSDKLHNRLKNQLSRMDKSNADQKLFQGSLADLSADAQEIHKRAFVTNDADADFHSLETIDFEGDGTIQKMQVPKGDILHQFRRDVSSSKLPAISWLSAPGHFSDHPYSPWYGAWYVSEVMDILTQNPEIWKKTIFILTYDENDGYFDHAPSFVAADPKRKITGGASKGIDTALEYTYVHDGLVQGVSEKQARSGPIGLGFRVPMILASPWSRGGWVNSQLFEHTSTIQFLEQFVERKFKKQVKETNISAWRRTISGDLTSAFRQYDGTRPSLPFLNRDKYVESIQRARYKEVPSNYKNLNGEKTALANRDLRRSGLLPSQEPGMRKACALPYEAYADGGLNHHGSKFDLSIRVGGRAAGFPFNVYLYGTKESTASTAPTQSQPNMISATYAVKANDALRESFDLDMFSDRRYDIAIHGPNGFFREFKGGHDDPEVEVALSYGRDGNGFSGNVQVSLTNKDKKACSVQIVDSSYGSKPVDKTLAPGTEQATVVLDLSKQHGWYDFTVRVTGAAGFERRYAGHVETGQPSYTDPLMGDAV
ncbi:MAG: phosphocholine-specific phospholipase C [Acidobacteriaceae bacterium]